jgi:FkbM family methyltransferase
LQFLNQQHPYIFNEVIESNTYELELDSIENHEFIDVGSNIGCFTSLVGYLNAKKVIAIEPVKTTYEQMVNNVNRLNLKNVITLQRAVGSVDDIPIHLFTGSDSGLNSVYSKSENYDVVNTITLKTLISMLETNTIFLKCDCEGAEYDLLMDASPNDLTRINTIAIEIHEDLHPKYKGSEILHQKFKSCGFYRSREKRIFTWDIDKQENITNMKPLPVVVEIWKK